MARFRALNTANISPGNVAAAAVIVSQKTLVWPLMFTAGVCTNAQVNQRTA